MSSQSFYAHGKLLLTGEYAVLDGAKALAIPCQFGQKLVVEPLQNSPFQVEWRGFDVEDELWISVNLPNQNLIKEEDIRIQQILRYVAELNPDLFYQNNYALQTLLEFPRNWGLGTSSTLISLLSQWAQINPFELLEKTFGGSGYDIACATAQNSIVYQKNGNQTKWMDVDLSENWTNNTYFIFLERKQNSREAIQYYRNLGDKTDVIDRVNSITEALIESDKIEDTITLLSAHEECMSEALQLPRIQSKEFADFKGVCKSLGAWGGDFMMAVTKEDAIYVKQYFNKKGLETIMTFKEMIWKQ